MGLFKREDRPHKTFAEIKAENEAKRQAKADQRHAEGNPTLTDRLADRADKAKEELAHADDHVRLRKIAADLTRPDDDRRQARAALTAAIGEEKADRVIRAEARMQRLCWTR